MQYKTIALSLLEQRQGLYRQLRKERMLLPAMDAYAKELKHRHQGWKEVLARTRPGNDPVQTASEALELAISELEGCLPPASPSDDSEGLSLDQAMAFIRRHTPPE
ncbi:MAG TPA: hypothetical protein VJ739_09385 [Gemmataceae bacterium]|nr:hypothetical protein [Gemmataceae bacterium]